MKRRPRSDDEPRRGSARPARRSGRDGGSAHWAGLVSRQPHRHACVNMERRTGMDLIDAACGQTACLMCAVEVGEHLRRDLADCDVSEPRTNVALVHPLVAVHRVGGTTLPTELNDPVLVQLFDCCGGSNVAPLRHLGEEFGTSLLGLAQVATEDPADLAATPRHRVQPSRNDQLPDPGRPFAHARRLPKLAHGGERSKLLENCWMGSRAEVMLEYIIPGHMGRAGGDRTHDRGIMSPLL